MKIDHDPVNSTRRAQAYARIATVITLTGLSTAEHAVPVSVPGALREQIAPDRASSDRAGLDRASHGRSLDERAIDVLAVIPSLRADLDDLERTLIDMARRDGASWARIATSLGLGSRQAAEQRRLRLTGDHHRIVDRSRQRKIDTFDAGIELLRAAVRDLIARLAVIPVDAVDEAVVDLAAATLRIAAEASAGALYDLARLAEEDLRSALSIQDDIGVALDRLREATRTPAQDDEREVDSTRLKKG